MMATVTNPRGNLSGRDQESEHRSPSTQDRASYSSELGNPSEDPLIFPYHGSCSKCHHLHINARFKLSRDPAKHTRFRCEGCSHQMFGIGRTSTQTTLASVESVGTGNSPESPIFPSQSCVSRPNLRIDPVAVSEQDNTLSTITEGNSPLGRSRSTSNVRPPEAPVRLGDGPIASTTGALGFTAERNPVPEPEPNSYPPPNRTERSRRRRGIMAWVKERLLSKRPKLKIHGRQRHGPNNRRVPVYNQTCSPERRNSNPSSHIRDETTNPETPDIGGFGGISSGEHSDALAPAGRSRMAENLTRTESPHTHSNYEGPGHPGPIMSEEGNATSRKQERVRAKRREATLKRQIAERPRCLCSNDCHCMKDNGALDLSSSDRRTSSINIEVPEHPLDHLLGPTPPSSESQSSGLSAGISFAGLGTHLSPEWRPSSSEGDSNTVAESMTTPSRLSRRTAIDGSTTSLQIRRMSLGRSSSVPVIQRRDRASLYDPAFRESIPRPEPRDQLRPSASEEETLTSRPPNRDGNESNLSGSTESSEVLYENILDHANRPNVEQQETQTQPTVDNASRSSPSTQAPNMSESQEITLRLRSNHGPESLSSQPAQAPPRRLSTGLEELANGIPDTSDFDPGIGLHNTL